MNTPLRTSMALLTVLSLAACGNTTASVTNDTTNSSANAALDGADYATVQDLVQYLESEGHTVETGPSTQQPYLAAQSTQLLINGQIIMVFQYARADAAERDTDAISVDGRSIGGTQMEWVGEPHFYQEGSLVVLYVGNDEPTLDLLEDALGAQVAGSSTDDEDDLMPGGNSATGTGKSSDDLDDF